MSAHAVSELQPATSRSPARSFMVVMAVAIIVIVVYGFSRTLKENLISPAVPPPRILYLHAVVMAAWLALFATQAALVRSRRVHLHRRLGQWGIALGTVVPVVGVATAVAMTHFRLLHGVPDSASGFVVPLNDMITFSVAFGLAVKWRTRSDVHRRLMYVATCATTAAAWGRMAFLDPYGGWFLAGVDLLVLTGAVFDLATIGRVHVVYKVALPAMIVGQIVTTSVRVNPAWKAFALQLFS